MLKNFSKLSIFKNSNGILSSKRFLSEQQTTKFGFEEVKTSEKQTKGYLFLVCLLR
jgi:hypothetical protein